MRLRLTSALAALVLTLLSSANAATAAEGIVAAAVPDALPLAARDAVGALVGFDVEVAKEIAKRLGRPLAFVTPGWSAILAGGWNGRWHYSVSNITPTEERSRRLDFPAVYRFEAVILVVAKDNASIAAPADASGKRIGVARATTFEQYLRRQLKIYAGETAPDYAIADPVIRVFGNKGDALWAVADGRAGLDAVVTSWSTAQAAIDEGLPLKIVPGFLFWEPVAVAVDKGDEELGRRIEEAVGAMMADGTLGELSVKWFGLDMTAPATP